MGDILAEKFGETLKKIGAINAPVSLIVDGKFKKQFEANGTKYVIMSADKVFNIANALKFIWVAFNKEFIYLLLSIQEKINYFISLINL